MKLGGNYTQPNFDPLTEKLTFDVYVGWKLYGQYESHIEAEQALRAATSPDYEIVGTFARTE